MCPIPVNPIPNSDRVRTSRWGSDEFQDINVYIPMTRMVPLGEMSPHTFIGITNVDISKMVGESIPKSEKCLSHILHVTYLTGNGIYNVGTPT